MGFHGNESHFQEDSLSINGTPVDPWRSWMHTFRGSLVSRLCLVDPSRNCPSSTDPSWAFWHQILYVKMQIWRWSSTRGAALYLPEACLLLATSAQGSKRRGHPRSTCKMVNLHLYSTFEKAFPFNEFRSHERILVQDFWTLRDNFLSSLCQRFYCY